MMLKLLKSDGITVVFELNTKFSSISTVLWLTDLGFKGDGGCASGQ